MSNNRTGQLLVVSSASGAGKTTLCQRLHQEFERLHLSISYTTRAPRGSEKDGDAYHFVETEQFIHMIDDGQFAEYARVHDNYYGTAMQTVRETLQRGDDLLFDIDIQGARQLKERFPDEMVSVFILPPSLQELEQRLRGRGTDTPAVIERRLAVAKAEMSHYGAYDYVVVNDHLEEAYDAFRSIYIATGLRRQAMVTRARSILAGTLRG